LKLLFQGFKQGTVNFIDKQFPGWIFMYNPGEHTGPGAYFQYFSQRVNGCKGFYNAMCNVLIFQKMLSELLFMYKPIQGRRFLG
jgi:hypothetical protein